MKIPDWEECSEMEHDDVPINPLERFVYDNEPAGSLHEVLTWRTSLQALVDYVEEQAKGGSDGYNYSI